MSLREKQIAKKKTADEDERKFFEATGIRD